MSGRGVRTALLIPLACALLSCGAPQERPRDLLFIVVDTLRADSLDPSQGADDATGPMREIAGEPLRRLAERGWKFERAYSQAPWTPPSVASLLTGRYPSAIGFNHDGLEILDARPTMTVERAPLAVRLAAAGFRTVGIVGGGAVSRNVGLDVGFDSWQEAEVDGEDLEEGVASLLSILRSREERPERTAVFLHTYEAHAPNTHGEELEALGALCEPVAAWAQSVDIAAWNPRKAEVPDPALWTRCLYWADVAATARMLEQLVDTVLREELLERPLIVLTSDHGEMLFETKVAGRGYFHGASLHEQLLRVPLLFLGPGIPAGGRSGEPVELRRVLPTVLAALGVEATRPELAAPLAFGGGAAASGAAAFSEASFSGPGSASVVDARHRTSQMRRVRHEEWRGAWWDSAQLPEEATWRVVPALGEALPEAEPVERQRRLLRNFLQLAEGPWPELDSGSGESQSQDELRRSLEALGYIGN